MERDKVRAIAAEVPVALTDLCRKQGVAIRYDGGSIGQGTCILKFEFSEVDSTGRAQTVDVENFRICAHRFGLKPEDLGRKFTFRGHEYEVTGLRPAADKYPVLAKRLADGKVYKFPAAQIGGKKPWSPSSDERDEMRAEAMGS